MSADALFPPLGPIEAVRVALDLVTAQLDPQAPDIHGTFEANTDLVEALVRLASLLAQGAATYSKAADDTLMLAQEMIKVIEIHQVALADLDTLDTGSPW